MITYLNRTEAAVRLGVSKQTISTYVARHWLRGVTLSRRWRIDEASVEALLRTGTPPRQRGSGLQ